MRAVTIEVKISGGDSQKVVERLTNAFEKSEAAALRVAKAVSSVTDKDVFARAAKTSRDFLNSMINSGGMSQYKEVLRQFSPILKSLQTDLKQGSFNQEDFNRRLSEMPPLLRKALKDVSSLGKNIEGLGDELEHGANGFQAMLIKADLAGRSIAFLTQKVGESWEEYKTFGKELSNVNTILGENSNIKTLRDEILALDPALGGATELTKGLFLALGSGVSEENAMTFLVESAKAAKAGVAEVNQTVDASTTVLASYKKEASEVNEVYDMMFETINVGKIEMPELARSIGQVSSIAALAGVSLEEMFAAVATASLTNKPSTAIEGLRSALSNIIKPSKQAIDLAEELGLEFNATALKTKGLATFLEEVSEKTGNSADKLAVLFGDVQGFNIVAALAGQNAKRFAENLDAMGNASGNVERAFQKQQQSLGTQIENFYTRIIKGFISAFTKAEPILKFILSSLNALLPVIVAVTVAATGLKLAWMLLNTQFFVTAGAGIGNAIAALQLMYGTLMSVIAGTASLQATLAVATGGLTLIGAAVGLVVYYFSNLETAIDKANKITLNSIKSNIDALHSYQAMVAEIESVTSAQEDSAERHDKLNTILGRLDPTTQAYIKSLKDEEMQIEVLSDKISKNIEVQKALLEAKLRTVGEAILKTKGSLEEENKAILSNQERIRSLTETLQFWQKQEAEGSLRRDEVILKIGETQIKLDSLINSNVKAGEEVGKLNKTLGENELKLIQAARGLGLNNQQLQEFFTRAGYTKSQVDLLTSAYEKTSTSADKAGNNIDKTTDAVNDQTKAVFNLRQELSKLSGKYQEKLDRKTLEIVESAKNKVEAKRLAKEAIQTNKDLKEAVEETKRIRENQKAVEEVFSPSVKSASRSGGRKRRTSRKRSQTISQQIGDKWLRWQPTRIGVNQRLILRQKLESMLSQQATKVFLETLRTIEGGKSPYIVFGGKRPKYAKHLNYHPGKDGLGGMGPKGWSTAAGLYQITQTNWNWISRILGTQKFSVRNQQLGALLVMMSQANKGFRKLAKGDLAGGIRYGTQPWAASPYSTLPGRKRRDVWKVVERFSGMKNLGITKIEKKMSERERNQLRIVELEQRIAEIRKNGLNDEKLKEELKKSELEFEKRSLLEIAKLRNELDYQKDAPMPKGIDNLKDTLKELQEFKRNSEQVEKVIENINKKLFEQGSTTILGSRKLVSPEDAKEQLAQWETVSKSLDSFANTSKKTRQQIIELAAEFDDGLTSLQRFDLEVKELEKSGKITAEIFNNVLKPVIEQTRKELELVAQMETAKKLRLEAKELSKTLDSLNLDLTKRADDLARPEAIKPLAEFLDQIEGIKELKLEKDQLQLMRDTFKTTDGIDVDKFKEYIRQWLGFLSIIGKFDASKIDETVNKLGEAFERFGHLTEAQKEAKRNEDFQSLSDNLNDEYQSLLRNGRQLTRYEETLKQLQTTYKHLSVEQKNQLLIQAQINDSLQEMQDRHAELSGFFKETFGYLFEGDFKGFANNFMGQIKDKFIGQLSDFISTKILGFDPNKTDNPVAKPIVKELSQSNKTLYNIDKNIALAVGGNSATGSFNLGSLGSLVNSFVSTQGTGGASINQGFTLSNATRPTLEHETGLDLGSLIGVSSGSGGGGVWSQIKGIFSGKPDTLFGKGGIFGKDGFGNNVGTYGAVGSIANLVGGLIGGKVGSVIGSTGSGLATGAAIGSMILPGIGTAVGAVVGGIVGFFSSIFGNKKRKRDKEEKLPQLEKGFTEAFSQLKQILSEFQNNNIRSEPQISEAVKKAEDIRKEISSGFGIQFESKRWKRRSQEMIQSKVLEADRIIDQIKSAADVAREKDEIRRAAAERDRRIVPEFASGGRISPVSGGQLSIVGEGGFAEYVLSTDPRYRDRTLGLLGQFINETKPSLPKPQRIQPNFSNETASSPTINVTPTVNIHFEQDEKGRWVATAETDEGQEAIVNIVEQKFKHGKMKLRKR